MSVTLYIFFFFNDTATTEIYTLSLHDALPIWIDGGTLRSRRGEACVGMRSFRAGLLGDFGRSEEHTSELQSLRHLVCRLLLEKKKKRPTAPVRSSHLQGLTS